jgi:hypothetical protein
MGSRVVVERVVAGQGVVQERGQTVRLIGAWVRDRIHTGHMQPVEPSLCVYQNALSSHGEALTPWARPTGDSAEDSVDHAILRVVERFLPENDPAAAVTAQPLEVLNDPGFDSQTRARARGRR